MIGAAGVWHFAGKVVIDTVNPLDFSKGYPDLSIKGDDSAGEAAMGATAEVDPPFEVAILDLHLPAMDGWATAAAIRAREAATGKSRLRLIAITADALPEAKTAASEAGFDLFLQKPVSPEALRAALAAVSGAAAAA